MANNLLMYRDPWGLWAWDNDWLETALNIGTPQGFLTKAGRAANWQEIESAAETAKEDWDGILATMPWNWDDTAQGSYHLAKEAGARNLEMAEAINEPGTSDWIVAKDAILFNTLDVVPGVSSAQLLVPVYKNGQTMSSFDCTRNVLNNVALFSGFGANGVAIYRGYIPVSNGSFSLAYEADLLKMATAERAAAAAKAMTDNLVKYRMEINNSGKATVAQAEAAGRVSRVRESIPEPGGQPALKANHAERLALGEVGDVPGPKNVVVDQVPCPGEGGCAQWLSQTLPPGSRVYVPRVVEKPHVSPKNAVVEYGAERGMPLYPEQFYYQPGRLFLLPPPPPPPLAWQERK